MILSGEQQNDDTTRAYSVSCSSKTPDANMLSIRRYSTSRIRVVGHVRIASSQGTCQKNFTTVRGCFGLGTARVKALGELKKEEEENEDDETRFSPFPGSSL